MPLRDSIALHTCPLLLRVGLAATFLWFGIPKWNTITYKGDDARRLVNLGIGDETVVGGTPPAQTPAQQPAETQPADPPSQPAPEPPAEEPPSDTGDQPPVNPDSPVSDQPAGDQPSSELQPSETEEGGAGDDAAAEETPPVTDAPQQAPGEEAKPTAGAAAQPDVEYEVEAKRVENLTLMLSKASHPYPQLFAWIAMITETVGGALLLIGLFSRVWGLGLAIAMVYAFAFSTLPDIQAAMDPTASNKVREFLSALASLKLETQSKAFFQLMLFIAAWCIFIGGPGAASLDRLIFRRRVHED